MRYSYLPVIIFLLVAFADAAQLEGPDVKLQEHQANVSAIRQTVQNEQVPAQKFADNTLQSQNNLSSTLDVEVTSDVYSEKDRHVLYCPRGNYMVVRNRIYLTGVDLDKVQKVEYLLHPTFSNPVAVSEDPTNDFEVWIWAWGGFPITATITTKTGQIFEKNYDFSFKTRFEEAQSKGIPQMMECNDVQ